MANRGLRIGYPVGYSLACDSGNYTLTGQNVVLSYDGASESLTWTAASGALGYRVYFGTASGNYDQAIGAGIDVGNVLSVSIASLGFDSDVTYFVVIRAYDNGGVGGAQIEGAPSGEVQILNGAIVT